MSTQFTAGESQSAMASPAKVAPFDGRVESASATFDQTAKARTVALIGAPTDTGAADRGSSMGPEALRVAGLREALVGRGLQVIDRGNLNGPGNPWQDPVEGYRHLAEVTEW